MSDLSLDNEEKSILILYLCFGYHFLKTGVVRLIVIALSVRGGLCESSCSQTFIFSTYIRKQDKQFKVGGGSVTQLANSCGCYFISNTVTYDWVNTETLNRKIERKMMYQDQE